MFKPLNDRILVKPDEIKEEIHSGIIIQKDEKEKATTGTVLTDGNMAKVGDRVLISAFGFDEADIDGELHYVVSEASLLGIF